MAQALVDFWSGLKKGDVHKQWTFGYAQGLLSKGLVNIEPFRTPITNFLTKDLVRNVTITLTDYNDGSPAYFDETTPKEMLADVLLASSSVAGFHAFQSFNNSNYGDGSLIFLSDIGSVVTRCRKIVDDDTKIIVDIIQPLFNEIDLDPMTGEEVTFDIIGRTLKIYLY